MPLYGEREAPITPGELYVSFASFDSGSDNARRALLLSPTKEVNSIGFHRRPRNS